MTNLTALDETSTLSTKLKAGQFAITAELSPPKVPELSRLDKHIENYRVGVDAVNILDMPSATQLGDLITIRSYDESHV